MAVRLARHGAQVSLITALADDVAGKQLTGSLAAENVTVVALPAARTGIVVSLVDEAGDRAMLSDRVSLDPTGLGSLAVQYALGEADWIHVSGYPLADPASGDALAALAGSRRSGQGCSVGGGSFDAGSGMLPRLRTVHPELALFDRAEALALVGRESGSGASESAEALATDLMSAIGATALVTDGAAGAAAATPPGTFAIPGAPGSGVDATGAGDAFGAGILLALTGGPWPPSPAALRHALEEASRLGAEVAGVVGAQARVPSEA